MGVKSSRGEVGPEEVGQETARAPGIAGGSCCFAGANACLQHKPSAGWLKSVAASAARGRGAAGVRAAGLLAALAGAEAGQQTGAAALVAAADVAAAARLATARRGSAATASRGSAATAAGLATAGRGAAALVAALVGPHAGEQAHAAAPGRATGVTTAGRLHAATTAGRGAAAATKVERLGAGSSSQVQQADGEQGRQDDTTFHREGSLSP